MAWTYSDWVTQSTAALRLSRLRLHIQEVSDRITADTSSAHGSVNFATLNEYLANLHKELEKQEGRSGVDADDVRVRSGFTRGRVVPR